MPEEPFEHQEIVRLLGKLKEETPNYPTELLEERKYSFMKQIVDLKISSEGPSGSGGTASSGKSGGSGAALGGGATFFGISLKAAFAMGAVIVLLTAAYLFRDQIVQFLAENEIINTEESVAPPGAATPGGQGQETQTAVPTSNFGAPPSGNMATQAAPGFENGNPGATSTPTGQSGPFGIIDYLICVLQSGTDGCR